MTLSAQAIAIAERVETFVRGTVAGYETDPRRDAHGPSPALAAELRELARAHQVLTPHILADGTHLSHRETALVLRKTGLSPLGPIACNTAAPDEGNMYLLGRVGSREIRERFLAPLVEGRTQSAFFMTEPADDGGAGSDPSMMRTTCRRDGNHWVIDGRKAFITGAATACSSSTCPIRRCASSACSTPSTARCPAVMPWWRSRACACRPIRCSATAERAFATPRSGSRPRG
jgi:acyl-CoA dehydrogenase